MTENIPGYLTYQKSITQEFKHLKDRFRDLVKHWPTDGGWKETCRLKPGAKVGG